MKKTVEVIDRVQGISDYPKEGKVSEVAWSRSIDMRSDPRSYKLLPKTSKESGSVVIDLPKWGDIVSGVAYYYGDAGNFYKRSTVGSHSLIGTIPNSHGNGLAYFPEDDSIYLTSDTLIARYGKISGTPTLINDYFGSQGGVPLNTNSLDLESGSSQYASRADTASLSITGNIAIEAQIKPESLPAVGSEMTIASKWDESGTLQSYKFSLYGISGYFGDGSSSSLTISADTIEAPIDSACTGTPGAFTLTATNASFAANQVILIHQSQGTGAGTWQRNTIAGYTAGTITLGTALNADYTTGAQVRVVPQYTNVTINSGVTYSAKAWNGTVGGILCFIANGTVTVTGSISASGKGFRGGAGGTGNTNNDALSGEGTIGVSAATYLANGNGGGGGHGKGGVGNNAGGGGGGGYANTGSNGTVVAPNNAFFGYGGSSVGSADLTTMDFGGGGGGAGSSSTVAGISNGGAGGGIVFVIGSTVTVTGSMVADGAVGSANANPGASGAGGGAGGSVLLKAQTATLGTALITAASGAAAVPNGGGGNGGAGSVGRIHLDYLTSFTGTTAPTLDSTQDNTLVTTTSYQLRLGVSQNGIATEYLAQTAAITTAIWQHVAVSWLAASSQATFFLNAVSVGVSTGTKTAIHDNASTFQIGMNKNGAGSAANFYDGLIDEVRLWNTTKTSDDFLVGMNTQISASSANLQAYYRFNGDYLDETANNNDLTSSGSPVFSTDVPFASPSTRLDIDQNSAQVGDTYALTTGISESATDKKTFTPTKDPNKSLAVNIAAKGTGDWTVVIHDSLNNVVDSVTIANALLPTAGIYEFVFPQVWRPVIGNSYHFHIYSSVADGTVVSMTNNDLETVSYTTYYQFLVEVSDYHPIQRFLNFIVIGNERYVAKWDLIAYEPHRLVLSSGWKVTCFTLWNEYLAIGARKSSSVYGVEEGRIWFWDGVADVPNFSVQVPEGAINSMITSKGILEFIAGYQGDLLRYAGGDQIQKVKRIPKITKDKYIEVMPGAMTLYQSILHYGVAGLSDSSVVERGVYSYGSLNSNYPEFLSYDYPISTGNRTATNIKVGIVLALDRKLLIGWQDNVSYGVDVVDPTGAPFSSGTIEYLIQDNGAVWKDKTLNRIKGDFLPLNTGESIDIKYQLDRSGSFTGLTSPYSTVGGAFVKQEVTSGRYQERQFAVDLFATGSTSPTFLGFSSKTDDNQQEDDF